MCMVICLVHHQEGPLYTHAAAAYAGKRWAHKYLSKKHTQNFVSPESLHQQMIIEIMKPHYFLIFASFFYYSEMDPHIMVVVVAILPMPAPGKKRPCHRPQPRSWVVAVLPQVWLPRPQPLLTCQPQSNPPVRT